MMSMFRSSVQVARFAATKASFGARFAYKPCVGLSLARFESSLSDKNSLNTKSTAFTYSKGPVTVKYTPEHEWVSIHPDGTTFVGITTYAADALGDATYVELPSDLIDQDVEQGNTIGSVESVKSASDIYSPVDGTVTEVNEVLDEKPALINEDPMGEGWITKIKLSDGFKDDDLLSKEEYVKLLEEADE
ncbi:hypothetical protein HII12_000776 [Brettanomyces bruxellensis]|uniref:Glycine cleavage system H protein n=1 Tax=Dekkera bruxellensis TaxID=5007 RepID=A0A8H6BPH2_DEKBR|nr:hypothetical protein HII12_000776 [Brettanomyces bruxellensis]